MADVRWIGAAADVKQVTTIAVTGTWATADTATLTINNKNLTVTVGSDSATTDVAAIVAQAVNQSSATSQLLNDESRNFGGQQIAEFTEIEATSSSSTITLTGKVAGVPFTVTASESTVGTGALGTPTAATAATGRNWVDNGANYAGGSVPSTGDTLVADRGSVDMLYGLDQLNNNISLRRTLDYTGNIGLPKVNSGGYTEYRLRFLELETSTGSQTHEIGAAGSSSPNGRTYLDLGTGTPSNLDVKVYATQAATNDGHAVQLVGGSADVNLFALRGSVSIGAHSEESVSVLGGLTVGLETASTSEVELLIGDYASFNSNENIVIYSGTTTTRSNLASSDNTAMFSGRLIIEGDITIDAFDLFGGTTIVRGQITTTAAFRNFGGTMDLSSADTNASFNTHSMYRGATLLDPNGRILGGASVQFVGCNPDDMGSGRVVLRDNIGGSFTAL